MGFILMTDGGYRGNPGPAGCGAVLEHDGCELVAAGWYLGEATNNHAEYCGLIWGLENALAAGAASLQVRADSELMVKQMTGVYKVKNRDMKRLHARASRLVARFEHVSFSHVPREQNSHADLLANEAMDARGPVGSYAVPFSEEEDESGTGSLFAGASAFAGEGPEHPAPKPHDPASPSRSAGKTVLLGVTGCIAAYKSCELVRCLQKAAPGIRVKVVMTEHAREFVGSTSFRALTGEEVAVGLFDDPSDPIHHISLAKEADVFCIAPATADVIAKLANGVADDLLTTTALATKAPLVIAPAMNAAMWADPATQGNVARCKTLGMRFVGPDEGYQACGDMGAGRMSEPPAIASEVLSILSASRDLEGRRVLVTAGPTHEPVDPVRFIGNRSSGKQGYAIAEEAALRGAQVTLVSGPVSLPAPWGVDVVYVETAQEMLSACRGPFEACDAAVFAAAVSDWRVQKPSAGKIKHDGGGLSLELVPNPDVAATLASGKGSRYVVVFAAETGDPLEAAREKLGKKHADLAVANDVSSEVGFGSDENHVWLVTSEGSEELSTLPKRLVARSILDRVSASLSR